MAGRVLTNPAGGRVEVTAGGALSIIPATWHNANTVTISAGTLSLGGSWTNAGTITHSGGTVNLGGTFSSHSLTDPGRFSRSGGTTSTVNVTGTVTNTGDTLNLNATSGGVGTWNLSGAQSSVGR